MGMVVGLTMLADHNIERLLSDPPLIWKIVAPDEPDFYDRARREANPASRWSRLFGKPPVQTPAVELVLTGQEGTSIDIDKSWHGIHYLLTGTADAADMPWTFLVSGGRDVGDIEVGYGPARTFTAQEAELILRAIDGLTDDQLRGRFDAAEMMRLEIYPDIWDRDPSGGEPLDYLIDYAVRLRAFLRQAVDLQLGLVVTLT